jgi:hypothetical protein
MTTASDQEGYFDEAVENSREAIYIQPNSPIIQAAYVDEIRTYRTLTPPSNEFEFPKYKVEFTPERTPLNERFEGFLSEDEPSILMYFVPTVSYQFDLEKLLDLEANGTDLPWEQLIEAQGGITVPTGYLVEMATRFKKIKNYFGKPFVVENYLTQKGFSIAPRDPEEWPKVLTRESSDEGLNAFMLLRLMRDEDYKDFTPENLIALAEEKGLKIEWNALIRGALYLTRKSTLKGLVDKGYVSKDEVGPICAESMYWLLMIQERAPLRVNRQHEATSPALYPISMDPKEYPPTNMLLYIFSAYELYFNENNFPNFIPNGSVYHINLLENQIDNLWMFADNIAKDENLRRYVNASYRRLQKQIQIYRNNPKLLNKINNPTPSQVSMPSARGFFEKINSFGGKGYRNKRSPRFN